MRAGIRISSLVPSGLAVESVSDSFDSIILTVRSATGLADCPLCGAASRRIHSRYARQVTDLPSAGKEVHLRVITRRFVCEERHCRRRIFAERFGDPSRSRRTTRLEYIVHHLGLALGGRPAASFAKRLMLPVSNDTLLRVVRRRTCLRTEPLIVAGIDDWAFRKNHRYGTIVCDLERRRIVTLLPDREIATVRAWLSEHPEIRVVSRDRGGGYGKAAAKALPDAIQVADRWHLMENASAAFLDAVRRSMRVIRAAIGATTINPELLTCAERLQYQGYLRRKETNAAIMGLVRNGFPLKEIVRRTGHSRKLVRQVSRGESTDVFRTRQSTLDAHLPFLDAQWSKGCRNGAELWRRLLGNTILRSRPCQKSAVRSLKRPEQVDTGLLPSGKVAWWFASIAGSTASSARESKNRWCPSRPPQGERCDRRRAADASVTRERWCVVPSCFPVQPAGDGLADRNAGGMVSPATNTTALKARPFFA